MRQFRNRTPYRLIAAIRRVGHTFHEATSAINARRFGDDFAAAESVCYCGGAGEVIRHALDIRRRFPATR